MGETEVTQAQWKRVMGSNPSYFSDCGDDCPVESVSWFDAVSFVNELSRVEGVPECYEVDGDRVTFTGLDCRGFRLPTEAEWEHAARAGTTTAWYFGSNDTGLDAHVWHRANSGGVRHPVGLKAANPWELFDVYGNVWEWCYDAYGGYHAEAQDPLGQEGAPSRVLRGGSFDDGVNGLRGAARGDILPEDENSYLGFRVAWSAAGGPN